MPFTRNNSIAITWGPQECHAVRLKAVSGGVCEVSAVWHGVIGMNGASSVAELVAMAARAVGADDNIYIIAGGGSHGWGMADVTLPAALSGGELRSALAFELHKQTPLPLDKLTWGYRVLQKGNAAKGVQQRIRLFYVRNENWDGWLKAIGGLHHVDAMLPAPAALDPLLADQTFTAISEGDDAGGYEYRSEHGRRVIAPVSFDCPPEFSQLLPMGSALRCRALSQLPAAEQPGFAGAVLLAAYGLGGEVSSDIATLPSLPDRFRAHRNIALKASAACLALYLLALAVYVLSGHFQLKSAQIRRVDQEIAKCRQELSALNKFMDPREIERGEALRQELLANTPSGPDFPTALTSLSRVIPAGAWIPQSLEWKEGRISFQTQSAVKLLELARLLEDSPYLGDVGERLSTFSASANAFTQRFELTARYDTAAEAAALKLMRAKERDAAARQDAARPSADVDDDDDASGEDADGNGGDAVEADSGDGADEVEE